MKYYMSVFIFLLVNFNGYAETTPVPVRPPFKSFEGTMKFNLPITSVSTVKSQIVYPRPGDISFGSTRYCGDRDVTNYYSAHPNEANAHGLTNEKLVMGYWVLKGTSASTDPNSVPDPSNWFAIGYGDLPIEGGLLTKLTPANAPPDPSKDVAAAVLLKQELSSLFNQFVVTPQTQTYSVYVATMLCNSYQDTSGAGPGISQSPTGASIAQSLIDYYNNQAATDVSDNLSGLIKLKKAIDASFTFNSGAFSLNVAFSSGNTPAGDWSDALSALDALVYPTLDVNEILSMGKYRIIVKDVIPKLNKLVQTCKDRQATGATQYWWESVPLSLECQNINSMAFVNNVSAFNGGTAKDDEPAVDFSQFKSLKSLLETPVAELGVISIVQEGIKAKDLTKNKARCFPVVRTLPGGRPYLETLIASMPFSFSSSASNGVVTYSVAGSKGAMALPEGNYISISAKYYDDQNAIFMAAGDPMTISTPTSASSVLTFPKGIYFEFHVRDYGCSTGPGYCSLKPEWDSFKRIN